MHLGIVSPPVSGHINPFAALGRELRRRGHRVTWFQMEDLAQRIAREDLDFYPIGYQDHPLGSLPQSLAHLGRLHGLSALRFTINAIRKTTEMICRDLPEALAKAQVNALLVDQTEPGGGSVAEHLRIPFITICNALALNRDTYVPPPFTPWTYHRAGWARVRNAAGYAISNLLMSPVERVLTRYRQQWNLAPLKSPEDAWSRLAQISQQPPAFDFPREKLPDIFHYVGPLRDPISRPSDFPWDRLDGRPLIYSSLGTLQGGKERIFGCFAEACAGLPVQLVIAHGGGLDQRALESLPGRPLAVSYAPQVEVLKRCSLTLTHAGLNTVLDSLSQGVPAIAVPIAYEQPAIAARLKWVGAGSVIRLTQLDPETLRLRIRELLDGKTQRDVAAKVARSILESGGVVRAADIVEDRMRSK